MKNEIQKFARLLVTLSRQFVSSLVALFRRIRLFLENRLRIADTLADCGTNNRVDDTISRIDRFGRPLRWLVRSPITSPKRLGTEQYLSRTSECFRWAYRYRVTIRLAKKMIYGRFEKNENGHYFFSRY